MTVDSAEVRDTHATNDSSDEDDATWPLDAFERPEARREVERAGELFLIATVGFGVSGLLVDQFSTAGGVTAFSLRTALSAAVLSSPLIGVITGALTGLRYDGDPGEVLAAAGAGAGLGAVICAGSAYFFAFAAFGTGVGLSVGAVVGLAVGTAITGGLAGLVTEDAS